MKEATKWIVRIRADLRCEYCGVHQRQCRYTHHIEHVEAIANGGSPDNPDNLALACHRCNLAKGARKMALDPVNDVPMLLFHPRLHTWETHFRVDASGYIEGLTPTGRATVSALKMNGPVRLMERGRVSL